MKSKKTNYIPMALGLILLSAVTVQATEYVWNNSTGNNNYMDIANWVTAPVAGNTSYAAIDLTGTNKAILSSGSTANITGLHIGYNGADGEFEQTGDGQFKQTELDVTNGAFFRARNKE